MRKVLCFFAGIFAFSVMNAQQGADEMIRDLKQKSDKFNVFLNYHTSLDAVKEKGVDNMQTAFKSRQLRLEFRGNITDRIFYRLRHRLNRSNAGANLDNLARATDIMYGGFRIDDKWTLTVGKMCQAWGGIEFDLNPMEIYEYSDMVENMDNFMVGGMLTYNVTPNHELALQITDVRNNKFADIYPNAVNYIKPSNTPLTYILNWNGNMFDGKLQTRWAYGIQSEADGYNNNMLTLGTKLNLDKFRIFFDYMREDDDLDRLGYAKALSTDTSKAYLEDVTYNTYLTKAEYQIAEKWNLFAQYMYETARVKETSMVKDLKRNSSGYYCGVEFNPFPKQEDLRFYAAYIGRSLEYTGADKFNSNRFSLGMMYRIKAF